PEPERHEQKGNVTVAATGFQVGVTHAQDSLDPWGSAAAIARGKAILRTVGPLQNQNIMGWGADNPEPSPGRYNWDSLDQRIALIRASGGVPVITLCCAPDWMKGGKPGHTNWNRLEAAPNRRHFATFARLAVAVAHRYPFVHYYQVWNELKGFWNNRQNRWDYEGYTALYNKVYDALKHLHRSLQIGGPYAPMDSLSSPAAAGPLASRLRGGWGVIDKRALAAVSYWLRHKHGAQFISVDGTSTTKDGYFRSPSLGAQKFAAVTRWLRTRTRLPIWWSEFYAPRGPSSHASDPVAIADLLSAIRSARASVALLWGPECEPNNQLPCIWTSTLDHGGGEPTPYLRIIQRYFGPAQMHQLLQHPQQHQLQRQFP
ncbi:MAG: xylan 1,4-beta-xylosidase, partial [Solirubrobacteraceae bacterium]